MTKWSVVACDQFTSQPEYWDEVESLVGDAPSTLRIMLPEIFLEDDFDGRVAGISRAMDEYINGGVFKTVADSFVYTERILPSGAVRLGLVGMLDLDAYDYAPGALPLARATEQTVVERLPPRSRIRERAALETPHIMLLIDDPSHSVIAPHRAACDSYEKLYDFALMQGGGRLRGYRVTGESARETAKALCALPGASPGEGRSPFVYAIGDGNHSLAAAKACYEKLKQTLSPEEAAVHPMRFALCELTNLYDESLVFEPIHRVVFGADAAALLDELLAAKGFSAEAGASDFELAAGGERRRVFCDNPLALAELQPFLDGYIKRAGARIDYIHGEDVALRLAETPGNAAFILRAISKPGFFADVERSGALPRKTFSMGEAHEKRYYLECRKISGR